ncbi:retinitis pigmentosa 1-like 1 protein isoform X1 [Poecilia latipinna]|uniref:Retinitis pigmentosa 1-like 1 protein n=1 Tax=Poecilia latipinna TaxID=48699 RepID=A0A3B3UMK2_9TELE|nr:PREDICTED: retinitis pigmentosa 1-like 1 protein isoform X1 [Poecilia latipinna]XP_014890348.1 PREDICTED: retinitis pigmentosa 1-like 1 protein isoform X1 [Poecilia latipinna]
MQSVQTGLWDPHPPYKHASPLPAPPTSSSRHAHVTTAAPAKRITFYKSGDSQFGGVRMAIHKRSFKCFDALLDDLSQKVPLPFGVRTVTTPRGTHTIKHLEQLQDGGCYLCSDRRQAKPINMDLASKRQGIWYHHSRRPQRPEVSSGTPPGHLNLPHRQRRILLVKNSEPGMRRSIVLSRRSTRSLRAFLDEVSEVMQFHVRKLYTAEGRRIDSVQSLLTCPGVLVCVGREAFSPMLINFIRKTSEEKLPGLVSKSPGLGPRIPGNGARSPGAQAIRSPPHGAQSRASEYDEGNESKKNVNFGLETKKSIIHPRSDSSNRSARFSLSSEKSYGVFSQARPAITNDDIEKRVLVNKDGSLSVEMRVRFRLQNEETVQWSTQIKKSPSLTNDCCPLSQAQPHYLQQGTSESCSDPDSTSYEGVDYSSRPLESALLENQCQCCYQRHERQFDLWENPTHKHPPAPPVHSSSHAVMRHTHSSSSSSSFNSRRLIRCRARVSGSPGGSGSGQSQLVQKEMCLTEQVEKRVEVAQDGDTQVEVCKVSRCCSRTEVVAIDTNIRPPSGKSVEGEVMMGEDEIRPLSTVSSSSHILQSLKEDQDDEEDDLPPSASQCSHRNEASPTPTPVNQLDEGPSSIISVCSVQSLKPQEQEENAGSRALSSALSCHCGATNPHSTAKPDQTDRVPSLMSQEPKNQVSEEEAAAAVDNEEINRGLSGLSHDTGLSAGSQKSSTSNVCSNCGGCKRANSAMSAQSGLSAKSKCTTKALLQNTAERTTSSMSNKSGASVKSHKSGCLSVAKELSPSNKTVAEEGDADNRAQSSLSMKSNASNKSGKAESVLSNKSDKSKASARSSSSSKQCVKTLTPENKEKDELNGIIEKREESGVEDRSASALSATSKLSAKSNKSHRSTEALEKSTSPRSETGEDAEEISTSQMSGRLSVHSTKSCKCNDNSKAQSPALEVENNAEEIQPRPESIIEDHLEDRSTSPRSCKSDSSAKSHNAVENRYPSASSQRSHTSAKSTQSKRSNQPKESQNDPNLTLTETNWEETDIEQREALESVMSAKSKSSVKSDISSKNPSATNAVKIKAPEGTDEAKEGEPDSDVACIETSQASDNEDDPAIKGTYTIDPDGQTLSPKRKPSSRSHSPSSRGSQSPVQKLSPSSGAGEQRGPSSLSVHSKTSSKVSRSRCRCEMASPVEKENKEEDRHSEGAQSCSSKRQRKESGCTDQPLSRNGSGSISLGLQEDQETAESDCGKSSVSFCNGERKSPSRHSLPVVDIPTIETPREGEKCDEEGGEQPTERPANATTVQSSRSHKSCCNCSVKSAAQSKGKSSSPIPTSIDKAESVKSAATTNACKMDTPKSRSSSAMSGTQVCGKSPSDTTSNVNTSTDAKNQKTSRPGSTTKGEEDKTSVHSQSPCGRRPESTASVQTETKRTSEERNVALGSVKSGDHKSHKGSECGSTKVSSSRQKETPPKSTSPCSLHSPGPASKVKPGSGSTLSHSLSAADLLKETLAAARQQDCQSKASKTSEKAHSEKSRRSQRSRSRKDWEDVVEMTPECLPNASPNEVVSDWLRSIPANTSMLTLDNVLNDEETEEGAKEMEETPTEEVGTGEMNPEDEKVELEEKREPQEEEKKDEAKGDGVGPTLGDTAEISSRSRNWHSSAAVMKVLLSSSLGRCRSMPEVSPVYGRRLSTSARGLLDCLAQLQLIEPAVSSHEQKDRKQQYDEIMAILQSLWLTEPHNINVKDTKDGGTDQVTPPRSSSGVGMSSGSGGSGGGKSNGNQGEDEPPRKETESLQEEEAAEKVVEEDNGNAAAEQVEAETEIEETNQTDTAEEVMKSEEQSTLPPDSSKATDNPSLSEKSSPNDSSKSERDTQEDSSSGTPPSAPRPPLSKRLSQDPDPVWVLHLLTKLEKQFMNHYIEAMEEFKVRWDLDDSLILDTMISELREEVSRRIQSSIQREMRKIQSRAGKVGRSPRPPQLANMSRDSTMTEKRRRMLKVMKNQSVKTAESLTDEEMVADFSDQRSDDEYCPCEACVRKKMAARPFKKNPLAAEAPVMMEFDLLKILQLKKSPLPPSSVPKPVEEERAAADEEGRSLEVVEEEEEEETKEDIKADVVLEETIPEEDEEEEQEKDEESRDREQEREENSAEDEELETDEQQETSENAEEDDEGLCTCQSESNKEEEGEAGETSNYTDEGEAGTGEEEEEESDRETVKEATTGNKEAESEDDTSATNGEPTPAEEMMRGNVGTSAEEEDEGTGEEEEKQEESEEQEGEASEEERNSPQSQVAIPAACVTEGEEADAEDSDDSKRHGDASADESAPEEAASSGEEEAKSSREDEQEDAVEEFRLEQESEAAKDKNEDGTLLHQFTRTSVESQPGSMEDVDMDLPSNSKVVDINGHKTEE